MDKNTLDKIRAEKPLDWQESAALEQALESQAPLKGLVASLDDPSVSLEWRSQLNERLAVVAGKRKRKSLVPWIGGFAAAAACAAAFVIFSAKNPTPAPAQNTSSFEAALAKAYTQTAETTPVDDELAQNFDDSQGL